jgi:hypothetical protein
VPRDEVPGEICVKVEKLLLTQTVRMIKNSVAIKKNSTFSISKVSNIIMMKICDR